MKSKDNGDKGYVTIDELADCLQALGFMPDDEDVEFLVKHMDDDGMIMLDAYIFVIQINLVLKMYALSDWHI